LEVTGWSCAIRYGSTNGEYQTCHILLISSQSACVSDLFYYVWNGMLPFA